MLADIWPGWNDKTLETSIVDLNEIALFNADDRVHGMEL
jgi:hypothetical protein